MANKYPSDSRTKEESFIYLKILTEEDKHVTDSVSVDKEMSSKNFHLEKTKCLSSDRLCFDVQHELSEKTIITRQATEKNAQDEGSCLATLKNFRFETAFSLKQSESTSKFSLPKIEGRKAPGANRILPLITSVWEDTDVHRKRLKAPKIGLGRKNSKGKVSGATKKHIQGNISGEEEEGDWLEKWDFDDLGGNIFRAYTDFFMAEEVGEDREDCICSECGEEFLTATHVAHHLESSHNKGAVKLHQCFVCRRKRYPSLLQLNHHLSEAHGIPRPQLTCRTCFMELVGESEAKAHSRKHQTPYKCPRCPLSHAQYGHSASVPRFATHFLLSEHLREVHLPSERPYVCPICGRHFLHEFVRNLHLRRRHSSNSLICPEIRNGSSSSQHTNSLSLNYFTNSITSNTLTLSNASSSKILEDQNASSSENDAQLKDQCFSDATKKKCERLPENTQVALQHNSVCCSKGSFKFPDDVSLLRHVFKSHEKQIRLQLLKWAKEVDREDTLFEKLWSLYLKNSSKSLSLKISVNEEKIASDVPNQLNMEVMLNSGRISLNFHSPNKQPCDQHLNKKSEKMYSNHDPTIELSHIINTTSNCSSDKVILPSGAVLSPTFLDTANQSSKFPAEGSPSTSCFYKKRCVESAVSPVESVSNALDVITTIQPFYPSPQKCNLQPNSSEVPIKSMLTNIDILESVKSCLLNIVDVVCDVFDEGSSAKELKNVPSHASPQKALSVRCLLCRYLASSALALEKHRRRRHFRNKHCPFCSLACLSVEAVWRHVSESHLNSPVKEVDGFVSKEGSKESEESIQTQKQVQSSSGLRCPICKKMFSSRGKCNSHQETVHKVEVVSRPLKCGICSKKFQFQKALERHQLLHGQDDVENGNQNLYSCPHCEQTFLRPGFLERHVASHFEVRREGKEKVTNGSFGHLCKCCSRRLPTHAKLKAHMRTSHPPSHLRQRFVCSQCPVKCNTASGLRVHLRVHTGERPYQCSKCSMSFKRQTALRKHMSAMHTVPSESEIDGVVTFLQCPNCSSSFRDRSNLVRHFLQVHRGLRRFVCGLCGAKYAQNQDLRRHLKASHSVDAPRIIGSDRRSAEQIYVVPPVTEGLPDDHPLVSKIRAIIEEEEDKLNEDSLPTFTETPQQLHLHIHKEPVISADSVSKEICNVTDHGSADPIESVSDAKNSTEAVNDVGSRKRSSKQNKQSYKTKAAEHRKVTESSGEVTSIVEENRKVPEDKNSSQPQRNLILDALMSSQISSDAIQLHNSVSYLGQGFQLNQVFGTNDIGSKRYDNDPSQAAEMNIIMTKQLPAEGGDSKSNRVELPKKSEVEELLTTDANKDEEDLVIKKKKPVSGGFLCCHCGKEFLDAAKLERHSKIHSDMKPHVCSICEKSFVEKYNLKVHMRTHTGERPYKCEVCGKSVRYLKEIADHRRMHLGEKPHVCDICSRAFLRLRDLQRHMQIHLNEKKHHCPICNKAFSRLDHLRTVHMRVHEPWRSAPSKPLDKALKSAPNESDKNSVGKRLSIIKEIFECEQCNKKFVTRGKLEKHLVLHSGHKAYKCSSCGRSFALASYLSAHQKTHKKQQAYLQCPKCPRRFVSQETLSVHEEKFHQRIEKMKKFQSLDQNVKAGRSKDLNVDICDEERFFLTRTGEFDVNLELEEEMSIQEVLFDPTSLSEAEKNNTFVYLHVISDDLQLSNENCLTE